MKFSGKIVKSFLFIWAAAILWIYIGSLVNFHQHKIWGRPLLPELLYAKRDKEHSIDFNKLIKPDIPRNISTDGFNHFIGIPASSATDNYHATSSSIILSNPSPVLRDGFYSSTGLRGPPVS